MARSVGNSIENNFVNGLITEATGLNFPENAATEALNVVFNENGRVSRRKGIDIEQAHTSIVNKHGNAVVSSYLWESVGGNGDLTFYVQQIGRILRFYNVNPTTSLSSGYFDSQGIPILVAEDTASRFPCQFAAGNGDLIVTHRFADPMVLRYNTSKKIIEVVDVVRIKIRDFEGVDDGYRSTQTRVATSKMSKEHWYNLFNQGWDIPKINEFKKVYQTYPGNCDVWWLYKDETETYNPSKMAGKFDRGNSHAPTGHFILDAFNMDRTGVNQGKGSIPRRSSGKERPSCVEFFAGRVWYAGVQAKGYGNYVYFSQTIEGDLQYDKCYQVNDPTAEDLSTLLPTDGGVIKILECGQIIKLWAVENYLLAFCSNGIWAITGSTGMGFMSNDYQVKKLSSVPAISHYSFIDMGGAPVWWNDDGIWTVSMNATVGSIEVKSLVDKKIKKWFDSVSPSAKEYAKGAVNTLDRTVQWLVQTTPVYTGGVDQYFHYDTILQLNMVSGAFSIFTIPQYDTKTPFVCDLVVVKGVGDTVDDEEITAEDGEIIYNNASQTVEYTTRTASRLSAMYKYCVQYWSADPARNRFSFADMTSTDWRDWTTWNAAEAINSGAGFDYTSTFTTGFKIRGDAQRKFQTNYVWLYSENENPSYCYLQTLWDYTTDGDTGRWSTKQKFQSDMLLRSTFKKRFKVRGHGIVCQLKITSIPGEPFDLVGWSFFESVNGTP